MMESPPCLFLGIKVKPGPIERHKLENFPLDRTVDNLKSEAEKKTNLPSSSLELIHHGKILRDQATLQDSGVKNGEMIHVVKKKVQTPPPPAPTFSDAELQQLNASLRTLGCTPNAPGWTRAMQLLNDDSAMAEILEHAPGLSEDCVALSILHEVELLAALGANVGTMRRGAAAHPALAPALRQLTRLVRARQDQPQGQDNVPTSGFAYSLEALSDDEEADEEETEEGERTPITQEQLAAALQAATEAVSGSSRGGSGGSGTSGSGGGSGGHVNNDGLLRLLTQGRAPPNRTEPNASASGGGGGSRGRLNNDGLIRLLTQGRAPPDAAEPNASASASRSMITPEMFSEAISEAITRAGGRNPAGTPMDQSTAGSSSESPLRERASTEGVAGATGATGGSFTPQLQHMHEMGLLDDALNVRALLIAAGDVNAAINLVFSGAISDD